MAVPTTTIGSYPKPDYVPLRDWYSSKPEADRGVHPTDPTRLYADFEARRTERDEELLDRGTEEVVREQDVLGIDIPTDGEIRRDHYAACLKSVGLERLALSYQSLPLRLRLSKLVTSQ